MNSLIAPRAQSSLAFLQGGGTVGALMRSRDWSSSPLGSPEYWPQSLRTVVDLLLHSKFPMFVAWGKQLGFLYNDPYIAILGAKHPAALGSRFHDIWSEIWDDINPLIERALAGEATYHENLPLLMQRRGYDEQTWFTFSYSPVRDESGAVVGMYCACTETTAQVLAEKNQQLENERLRNLFEQAPGIMAVARSPQHVFELTNKAYLQLIGHRNVIGKPVREALPELEGQGFFELLDQVYATGEPFIGKALPVKLQRQPGSPLEELYVDFVYQPIRDATGAVVGIFCEGSDVTERQKAFNELSESDRRKDEFLAMLAHELRNPLAPISTAAQLLKRKRHDEHAVEHASDIISRQVEHMTELVNDLLDVSRVTRGLITLELESLDLNEIVAGAVEQVRSLIEMRRHRLTLQLAGEPTYVQGDRTRLVQVITNLLNNAAKFTPVGGEILLRIEASGQQVRLQVKDNGPGIPATVLPYIFELFTQAERTPDRAQGGLGLGLALVKSLIELHGGTVNAKSEGVAGKGCEFTLSLPRLAGYDRQYRQENEKDMEHSNGALRIMVVDDNVDAAQTLAMLLEIEGHNVAVEYDAKSALKRVPFARPQALLLDVGLPDMDGYELARSMRALPETANAVLIALTGYGQSQDMERSKSAGFDHHLVKPADTMQILDILAQVAKAA